VVEGWPDDVPSELRERLLAQHSAIEGMIQQLEGGVGRLRVGDRTQEGWLKLSVASLRDVLSQHMQLEERALIPMVRQTDGFGPIRAANLALDHHKQAVENGTLIDEVTAAPDAETLVSRVKYLATVLRENMAREERLYVNDRLLRDDLVPLDAFEG
jgi:hypothetical protein